MTGIKDFATFFAGERLYASDLIGESGMEQRALEYFGSTGIETVYDAKGYSGYEMAKQAVLRLMERNGLAGKDIDLIIYIQNRLPAFLMSSSTARLQHEIGAENAGGFSLSDLGCTDMSMAIKLAKDYLIANKEAELVLIAYGNAPYTPSRFRWPVTINGDGAVALMVTRCAENEIVDVNIRLKGSYWDLFRVDCGDRLYEDYKEECTSQRKYGFELAIESRLQLGALNEKTLGRNGLGKEDVRHYLLQNLSLRAFEVHEQAFGIAISNVCRSNLKRYGHLGPADVMINYQTGLETGLFRKGEHVLIMNNSPVASWSNILLRV